MKIYLVGGAVRDKLLGRTPKDMDYVVVGSTPEEMLSLGYKQVGSDFPVFLHPETGDEYALARHEVSTGPKHTDFEFLVTPDVSLTYDLYRRDLTINAIAYDVETEEYIDPFGGILDLHNKTLRYVSKFFCDDPLRVLRVARFASQLDFKVSKATLDIMQEMAENGNLSALTCERIFMELDKALNTNKPSVFFNVLRDCNALQFVFPIVYNMIGRNQKKEHHPEGDVYNHTMLVIDQASETDIRFAGLCHDFGKTITPKHEIPSYYDHDNLGVPLVQEFCEQLRVPKNYKDLAVISCKYHMRCHKIFEMSPQKILKLIKDTHGLRPNKTNYKFGLVCRNDYYGRKLQRTVIYHQLYFLKRISDELCNLNVEDLVQEQKDKNYKLDWLKEAIHKRRLNIIKRLKKEYTDVL